METSWSTATLCRTVTWCQVHWHIIALIALLVVQEAPLLAIGFTVCTWNLCFCQAKSPPSIMFYATIGKPRTQFLLSQCNLRWHSSVSKPNETKAHWPSSYVTQLPRCQEPTVLTDPIFLMAENEQVLVVQKPPGLPCHPQAGFCWCLFGIIYIYILDFLDLCF